MTTAKATAMELAAGRPGPRTAWWLIAAALLGIAFAAVVTYIVADVSSGHMVAGAAPLIAEGADLVAVQGSGRKDDRSFVLERPGPDGISILTAKLSAFRAKEFSRVEWALSSAVTPPELALVWRTRENPRRNYTKRLRSLIGGTAPVDLKPEDGWSGTITGVALLVGPGMSVPLRVDSLRIVSPSAIGTAGDVLHQWSAPVPLRGYSVNFPFDSERGHELPPLIAIAVAEALALALYVLLARWRGWPRDRRIVWGIFLGGWLLLDVRWQSNLWREAGARAVRFAGKTTAEMHLAADDAELFSLVDTMKRALPATPSRIFLYCDDDALCARAAFMLYPQNLYRAVHWRRKLPGPEEMHDGDHVLLVYSRALGYDREHRNIVWRDGRTKPADEILLQPGALLLRVR